MRGTPICSPYVFFSDRFIPAYAGNTPALTGQLPTEAVHPRVCGEHGLASSRFALVLGSSPRMRGTHAAQFAHQANKRFIPAYAGNTACRRRKPERKPVHPRVCGEHEVFMLLLVVSVGSSPRMRGTRARSRSGRRSRRFIPAYAGNTCHPRGSGRRRSVHPRVCGEHSFEVIPSSSFFGSSPRMRGTRLAGGENPKGNRFIPAYAGNTKSLCFFSW